MKNFLSLLLFLVWMSALSSCGGSANAVTSPPEAQFVVLNEGSGSVTKKQSKVILNQIDYASELAVYTNATPGAVDFTKGKVLLLDMGPRNTGGYSIRLATVDVSANWVVANIELVVPGQNCIVIQATTNPYQFVYIPTQKEILLSEKQVISNC